MYPYLLLVFSLFCFFVSFFNTTVEDNIFPSKNVKIYKVEDSFDGGTSFVDSVSYDSVLSFRINLRKNFQYPYAGIGIQFKKRIDLSEFDSIKLSIDSKPTLPLIFTLKSYEKGVSNYQNPHSFLYFTTNIFSKGNISIALKDLNVPDWWMLKNKRKIKYNRKYLKTVEFIEITNGYVSPNDSVFYITLKSIKVKKKNYLCYILFFLGLLSIVVFIIVKSKIYKKFLNKKQKIEIPHVEIAKKDYAKEIIVYILKNYTNSELSIDDIAREVGLNKVKVSEIIKKVTGKNFKAFLNEVRLKEAARLIKEGNLQISEIAYQVGYNSISHFNRVFKNYFKVSPTEFKDLHMEN